MKKCRRGLAIPPKRHDLMPPPKQLGEGSIYWIYFSLQHRRWIYPQILGILSARNDREAEKTSSPQTRWLDAIPPYGCIILFGIGGISPV